MNTKTLSFTLLLLTATGAAAQTAREEIAANRYLAGSNYLDYNRQLTEKPLTPAPKGYEPYYMSHYGRHGSRWLIAEGDYTKPLGILREARRDGKLTAEGEATLQKVEAIYRTTHKRLGDLTTVGERQHHGIAQRMVEHFPELFKQKNLLIDARSTVVTRCILSMIAECEELAAANPTARIHNDVSDSLQFYLNQPWEGKVKKYGRTKQYIHDQYKRKWTHPERLMRVLFNDEEWVYNNVPTGDLMRQLFDLAGNMQSHDSSIEMFSLFTDDELYDLWRQRNIGWYLDYGPAKETGNGIMPYSQENLLRNIIETADTVTTPQATLRFGHEVCVMPLACLLEMDSCGVATDDLDRLDDYWRNYRIFPMGSNIQLVFYRPKKGKEGDILVKGLLNERETTLPVNTDQWPYYRWADLRQYYMEKLRKAKE